jgi:ABC-2 type transport system permease protein
MSGLVRTLTASAVLQARLSARAPFELLPLFTIPFLTAGFLAIFRAAGRVDLDAYALVAPALIALWQMALMVSGEIISNERSNQSFEPLVAAPVSINHVLLGRIGMVTLISMLGFVEAVLTGWLLFSVHVTVASPLILTLALGTAAFATACTAVLMAVVFINAGSPRVFQNSLSYPFYLIGGVLVPVALYPDWLQPVSRVVFLSWSADLLRDAIALVQVDAWLQRNLIVVSLGLGTYVGAMLVLRRTLRRARQEGRLGIA